MDLFAFDIDPLRTIVRRTNETCRNRIVRRPNANKRTGRRRMTKGPAENGRDATKRIRVQTNSHMIDTRIEQLLTMEEAGERMRVTPKTIRDWSESLDYLGRERPVVLEVTQPGGKLLTSVEALARYDEAKRRLREQKKTARHIAAMPAAASLPPSLIAHLASHGMPRHTTA